MSETNPVTTSPKNPVLVPPGELRVVSRSEGVDSRNRRVVTYRVKLAAGDREWQVTRPKDAQLNDPSIGDKFVVANGFDEVVAL